ncbi:F-box/LRR-repeat protein 10 [Oryza sativa Japonica Group]|uniref:Leucine Rich Repeat family protein, expressed n=5 Tax=Oryza TaxID=4527 RepID=Q10S47_ORYSJ|nr:F-box/LRR-repeat protein 10 [Oryza sativa Japonica Group]KAB8090086.1 hypothetical protein EE612_015158 [Oryza sativa]ABF93847.1 Leucine Rich Repeat family protein, expressed [Oryza sativa Japonica Group]USI00275.1 F-box domain and LRR containing protein [Oryza sativa Japonica Group]BAF10801.1 Os03g0135400 [Oryza sativa Japonica Group]BAS82177.1 Os03g0135400 [Oryza sativa Japonica Group]|eukprot:NP_001048887.1 Os03g0135400 [Oryza sativa Japonica Group]
MCPPPPDPISSPPPPAMDSALPSAVLATILSRLDVRSLVAASAACRCLRSCASHALSFLPSFHLSEVALTHELLRPLMPLNPSLRSIRLDCARLEDAAIDCLARPDLHELMLLNCDNISGRLLCELGATCQELRVLSLNALAERRGLPISFSDLQQLLNGCSQLESLRLALDFSMFDDPNFSHVWASASEALTSLEIGYIPMTMLLELLTVAMESQRCMHHVKEPVFFPSLQKLCLTVDFITDHLIGSLSTALPSLTHLDLQDAPIIEPTTSSDLTNAGLQQINPNGKLKHISLMRSQEFLFTSFRRVNDLGILLMAEKCSSLESVCLGGFSRVTDTGFRAIIHSCSGLHKLRVSHGSQFTDLVFHDIIATSLCLTHVSLRWCNLLTDVGIERLSFNKDLNVLDLRDCRSLGDEAVRSLSCLPKLQILFLDGSDISDQALKYLGLGTCPLASLSLRGCRKLTNDCIPLLFAGSVKQSLQVLDLSRIPGITDDGIMLLARSRTPIIELRMRENPKIGDAAVMALASMLVDGGTHGSSLQLLDLYDCGAITPLAIRWFKKPYFPRLRWLGVTGSLNRVMVDALVRSRPFLHMACRGEELGTFNWDRSSDWYRHDDDDLDELEQWILNGEPVSDTETITEE